MRAMALRGHALALVLLVAFSASFIGCPCRVPSHAHARMQAPAPGTLAYNVTP